MKTLLYPAFDYLELADLPVPTPAADEVLLKVTACGICGSELETFKNRSTRRPPPLVMGHEFCGVVESTGERVVSNALVPCGRCVRCRRGDTNLCAQRQIFGMHRPGAFAEYVSVPAACLIPFPQTLPPQAACLAEPLGNGVHIVELTKHLNPRTVLIIGAGPIGLMCQQAFQALLNATVIVSDRSSSRLEVAESLGALRVVDAARQDIVAVVQELTEGEGVDLVVDAVGAAVTKNQSLRAVRPGGAVVWIGLHENELTLNSYDVTLPEKQILGTYGATLEELKTAVDLMTTGRVDATSWVQTYSLEDGVTAFQRMLAANGRDIKAVILP